MFSLSGRFLGVGGGAANMRSSIVSFYFLCFRYVAGEQSQSGAWNSSTTAAAGEESSSVGVMNPIFPPFMWPMIQANGETVTTQSDSSRGVDLGATPITVTFTDESYRKSPQCTSDYFSFVSLFSGTPTLTVTQPSFSRTMYDIELGCCYYCQLMPHLVDVFMWPLDAVSPDAEKGQIGVVTAGDNTTHTITHPYIYAYYQSISAFDACGTIGGQITSTLYQIEPKAFTSTIDFSSGRPDVIKSMLNKWPAGAPGSCQEFEWTMEYCNDIQVHDLIGPSIRAADPAWESCSSFTWNSVRPMTALETQDALAAPPEPGSMGKATAGEDLAPPITRLPALAPAAGLPEVPASTKMPAGPEQTPAGQAAARPPASSLERPKIEASPPNNPGSTLDSPIDASPDRQGASESSNELPDDRPAVGGLAGDLTIRPSAAVTFTAVDGSTLVGTLARIENSAGDQELAVVGTSTTLGVEALLAAGGKGDVVVEGPTGTVTIPLAGGTGAQEEQGMDVGDYVWSVMGGQMGETTGTGGKPSNDRGGGGGGGEAGRATDASSASVGPPPAMGGAGLASGINMVDGIWVWCVVAGLWTGFCT